MWWNGKIYFLDLRDGRRARRRSCASMMLLLVTAFWQEDDRFLTEIVLSLSGGDSWPDLDMPAFETEISNLFMGVRGQSLREIQLGPVMQDDHARSRRDTTFVCLRASR